MSTGALAHAFELLESKMHAPPASIGVVDRGALLERLDTSPAPVVAVVAPPGYGKTTLLAQWAERKGDGVGWISADTDDNDPATLLTYVAAALDRIEPLDPAVFRTISSSRGGIDGSRRVVAAMASMRRPFTLVLDNLEAVTSWESLDAVAALTLGLPAASRLAIGSRDVLPLPTALLRSQGGITEIGVDELAMGPSEAGALLVEAGLELDQHDLHQLLDQTEGWPVGLYLAALAARAGGQYPAAATFRGDDRFMGDYLRSELLGRLSDAEVSFLTRTAVVERLCGPLCDALLETKRSGAVLQGLESRNLLVVPLDRRGEWYRYHHLFRELLTQELGRREPELVGELHLRAATWYEANGQPEAAIGHAQAAADVERVARLVLQIVPAVWASGRVDTVMRWMEWFDAHTRLERLPAIAVHGAVMFALVGQPAATERWAVAAERVQSTDVLPDGNTMEGMQAYLRALLCRGGLEQMRQDADLACKGLDLASPYRSAMLHAEGASYLLQGDPEAADAVFARALDFAVRSDHLPFVPVLLAERGIAAVELDDWDAADAHAAQMLALMEGGQFDDYWTSALVYAFAARACLQRGDPVQGREHAARAARLRPLLNYALPVVSAQALLEMARAYIALGDYGGTRAVLRQVQDIFQQRPSLGVLPTVAADLRSRIDSMRSSAVGVSSLTTAELRILPLLSTHLTFREIGERLYVSRHTVKTQAISIYRKLGVSSRGEALDRLHEFGLLDQA